MDSIENLEIDKNIILNDVSSDDKDALVVPPDVDVIFFNDNITTMDFIIKIIRVVFGKTYGEAVQLTNKIHETGKAIIGTYTYDIAYSIRNVTLAIAMDEGYPLKVGLENNI